MEEILTKFLSNDVNVLMEVTSLRTLITRMILKFLNYITYMFTRV